MKATREKHTLYSPMPHDVRPMLCTLLKKPFQDPAYLFEVKWDGYRILAYKDTDFVKLSSRRGHDYTRKYPPIARALEALPHDLVLDGEVTVLNPEGRPDFDALQKFNGQQSGVFYYVFDILWLDGTNLMPLPLLERKTILEEAVGDGSVIRYSDHFEDGIELFRHAQSLQLEGIIAKKKDSPYIPDRRGKEWYKIPTKVRQEFVVGGWVESESRLFRTLLFGAYDGEDFKWIGHAGGGFKDREMGEILERLKRLEVRESPFVNEVEYDGVAHWVKPELVVNIGYATFTRSGKIRKPAIFLGFREDKHPKQVIVETATLRKDPSSSGGVTVGPSAEGGASPHAHAVSNWPLVESEKVTNETQLDVDPCPVRVYNVDRVLWKGVTKAQLLQYYHAMSPWMLPHLRNRPLSLYLKLRGPHAPGTYIKDMEGRQPPCAEIFTTARKHHKAGKRDVIDYLVCNNTATLLYIINLGCIDVNPWTSSTMAPEKPDYIVIDLDPSDKGFSKAVESARAAKDFFDQHKLRAFPKTSGQTGMHLYLPCSAFTFPEARRIAENICAEIHWLLPHITTTEVAIARRGTRLYLDPSQNDYADTVAAPYSVRPHRRPTVSTPLTWREVNTSADPADFTMAAMERRIKKKGDLFESVLDARIARSNDRALRALLA